MNKCCLVPHCTTTTDSAIPSRKPALQPAPFQGPVKWVACPKAGLHSCLPGIQTLSFSLESQPSSQFLSKAPWCSWPAMPVTVSDNSEFVISLTGNTLEVIITHVTNLNLGKTYSASSYEMEKGKYKCCTLITLLTETWEMLLAPCCFHASGHTVTPGTLLQSIHLSGNGTLKLIPTWTINILGTIISLSLV